MWRRFIEIRTNFGACRNHHEGGVCRVSDSPAQCHFAIDPGGSFTVCDDHQRSWVEPHGSARHGHHRSTRN